MAKKSLIFFCKNMNIGGMEKALLILLNSLIEKDYSITLVLEEKSGVLLGTLDSRILVKEYRLSRVRNVFFRKFFNFAKRILWMLKNRNKYDFSCSYATYSVIGSKLARYASKKSVLYVHNNYYDVYGGDVDKIKNYFHGLEMEKFWKVAFVSNESKIGMKNVFPLAMDQFVVINNLFDYHFFEKVDYEEHTKTLIVDEKKKIFLFLGRLDEKSKKLSLLLETMRLHRNAHRNIVLWVVGDGPNRQQYVDFVEKYDLSDIVTFCGEQTKTWWFLYHCDYVILTSEYEGFPVVYFEAIYFQKPIITTIGVSDQFININDYGIVVDKNVESIERGMLEVQKKNISYSYDFKKIQELRIKQIIDLIED